MDSDSAEKKKQSAQPDAIQHAIEYGVDISLLVENLRLTPTQRLQRGQQVLDSVLAVRTQVQAFRAKWKS